MNINSQNVSESEEALKLASNDLIAFGKLFLPNDFMRSETPPFHFEMADHIDNLDVKQLAIIDSESSNPLKPFQINGGIVTKK